MTRVIHTADTHVGYRQYHSPERREDFLRAFEAVVGDAVEDDADALIHAGDLFHDRRPELRDLQGVIAALRTLDDAGIPFLAVVGNHESKRDAQWLDLFEDLGLAIRLGAEPYRLDDLAVYGLDFVPRSRREGLEYDFAPNDADHAVLVSHGLFEPFAHADWDTDRLLSESNVEFDALLLGDNHAPGREEVEGTLVTYSGSTERASASERDDRGYNIVTADEDLRVTRRGVPDTREFCFVDVELGESEGEARVREQVRQHQVEDAVVVVTIEGEGDPVTPAAIEELATERGALVARVNDRREIEEEAETEVSFADPDEAVDERIADLGLSTAAHGIDEVVRASKVADSNVREAVENQVREHLEEDDLDAFRGAGSSDGDETAADPEDAGEDASDPAGTPGDPAGTETRDPDEAASGNPDGAATGDPDGTATGDPDGTATGDPDGTATGDPVEATSDDAEDTGEGSGSDSQASVEEYL